MVQVTANPDGLGFDPARLARIDAHFSGYVETGRLPGWQIVVTRRGQVVHASTYGRRDVDTGAPVEPDTLWRIYSMTKPITTVAAMILWEQGRFELTDEVSRYLPAFAGVRVYDQGSALRPITVPAVEPVRIWHLMTHTSGLTYGFLHTSPVDEIYRGAGFDWAPPHHLDLAGLCDRLAGLPLLFQPGSAWGYSVATDVLGRLVEVISGQRLDQFLDQHVLQPIRMTDTRWWVAGEDAARVATLYGPEPGTGRLIQLNQLGGYATRQPPAHYGGGGLLSTAQDYHRFTQMLLGGGQVDGVRLLGSRTVALMTRNHLPGGQDLDALSTGGASETSLAGIGYGLGLAVVVDNLPQKTLANVGEYYWGGAASTAFWVDPAEELTAMLFTQLLPSSTYQLRPQLRQLVYSALVD